MALLYPLYMHYKERIHNRYGPYLAQLRHGAGCRNCQAQWRNSEGTKMDITMGLKAEGSLNFLLKPLLIGDFPASHVWWNQRLRGWRNPNILEWWEMTMLSNAWSSDLKREQSENPNQKKHISLSFRDAPCMVLFTYSWVIYGVNVGKYSIHGASGIHNPSKILENQLE